MKYHRQATHKLETKATNKKNRVSIHERPAQADGSRFEDWEMNPSIDKNGSAILFRT